MAARPFEKLDRICKLLWVNNVKQTKIYYKEYTNIKAAGEGGYAIIKLGGEAYSTSMSMKSATILSGNYEDITAFAVRDAVTGYVYKPTSSSPQTTAAAPTVVTREVAGLLKAASTDRSARLLRGLKDTPARIRSPTTSLREPQ